MCGAIVAGHTWFDDLTKRFFDREEVIIMVMFQVKRNMAIEINTSLKVTMNKVK